MGRIREGTIRSVMKEADGLFSFLGQFGEISSGNTHRGQTGNTNTEVGQQQLTPGLNLCGASDAHT